MATSRRQSPLESQGARMPMNGEPRMDLTTRTESLPGDDDLTPARTMDGSTVGDYTGLLGQRRCATG
jgi:hypothetical protein